MYARGKGVGPRDGIVAQVHGDKLRPTGSCVRHGHHLSLIGTRTSRVQHPEDIVWSNIESLNTNECTVRAATKGDANDGI